MSHRQQQQQEDDNDTTPVPRNDQLVATQQYHRSLSADSTSSSLSDTSTTSSVATTTTTESSDSAVSEQIIAEVLHTYRAYAPHAVSGDTVGSLQSVHLDPYVQVRTNGGAYGSNAPAPSASISQHHQGNGGGGNKDRSNERSSYDWMAAYQESQMSRQTSVQRMRRDEMEKPSQLCNKYTPKHDEEGYLHPDEVRRRSVARRRRAEQEHLRDHTFRPCLSRPSSDVPDPIGQIPLSRKGAWEERLYGEYARRQNELKYERQQQFLESNKRKALLDAMECTFDPRQRNEEVRSGKTLLHTRRNRSGAAINRERQSETRLQPDIDAQQQQQEAAYQDERKKGSMSRQHPGEDVEAVACERMYQRTQRERDLYIERATQQRRIDEQERKKKEQLRLRPNACHTRLYSLRIAHTNGYHEPSQEEIDRRTELAKNGGKASERLYQDYAVRELRIEELRQKYRPSYHPQISGMAAALPRQETSDEVFERLASARQHQ